MTPTTVAEAPEMFQRAVTALADPSRFHGARVLYGLRRGRFGEADRGGTGLLGDECAASRADVRAALRPPGNSGMTWRASRRPPAWITDCSSP